MKKDLHILLGRAQCVDANWLVISAMAGTFNLLSQLIKLIVSFVARIPSDRHEFPQPPELYYQTPEGKRSEIANLDQGE